MERSKMRAMSMKSPDVSFSVLLCMLYLLCRLRTNGHPYLQHCSTDSVWIGVHSATIGLLLAVRLNELIFVKKLISKLLHHYTKRVFQLLDTGRGSIHHIQPSKMVEPPTNRNLL